MAGIMPSESPRLSSSSTAAKNLTTEDDEDLAPPTVIKQRQRINLGAIFSTSTEYETKRAMQSRHLMMIGVFLVIALAS